MENTSITPFPADPPVLHAHVGNKSQAKPTEASGEQAVLKTSEPPLLSLNDVWKVFDGVSVLCGVSLDLRRSEIHAILGGNGSGKSTLMKILSGIYQLDDGTVELDG